MSGHSAPPSGPQTTFDFNASPPPEASALAPGSGVRLEIDDQGLGWIVFDLPGEKVNKLTAAVMEALRAALDEAARRKVRGLALVSDKAGTFLAGADVNVIAQLREAREGTEKAKQGQAVFESLAGFPVPTVAVVAGTCVGGGYELALACHVIVAEERKEAQVGLPEVRLGILPGFGGTQRLPRRAGLRTALDVVLAGKTLPARPAFRRGLVDLLVPEGRGRDVARDVLLGRRPVPAHPRPWLERILETVPPLRRLVLSRARTALAQRVRAADYPAPYAALDSIAASYRLPAVEAYGNEARLLGELAVTETSRNLTWLFLESRRAKEPVGLDLSLARPLHRLAVVGAGVMGGGIAGLAAEQGFPIRVKDIEGGALEKALATACGNWNRDMARRRLTPLEHHRRLEQLSFTLDYSGFRTVDVVMEAVVEKIAVKHEVFTEVERVVREDTVIATNTSSLRVAALAAPTRHPERFVGLHFFNPVDRMPLVEVVAGPRSAPWAVSTAYRLALDLGKTPILVRDGPGFLVNRLLAFYLGEALDLLQKGANPIAVDRTLTAFGMPMGPFALLDQVGLDVAEKVTHEMAAAFGDRLPAEAAVARLAGAGHLGQKSGRGFYLYKDGRRKGWNPEADRAAGNPGHRDLPEGDVLDRVLLPLVNEAARCLDEGVVRRPLDVDLGLVMGTGFPPFRGGLLRYADRRGVEEIVARLDVLAQAVDRRFAPSASLRSRTAGFYAGEGR